MKLGNIKIFILWFFLVISSITLVYSDDKIETVPLINLEDLSATFEEDKDELEKIDTNNLLLKKTEKISTTPKSLKKEKIYINIKALDKITAKTSSIRVAVGEKKSLGSLEISALKCSVSEKKDNPDTVAYIQVKDLSNKNNDQVFLFNGWTFASSPTLQAIDHPVYDLWITDCENI